MEVKAEYRTKADPIPVEMVYCQACDVAIGSYTEVTGQVWIEVNGLLLYVAHGKCALCGEAWHFVGTDVKLARLLERIKNRPKLTDIT